jgi:hypothetical protein
MFPRHYCSRTCSFPRAKCQLDAPGKHTANAEFLFYQAGWQMPACQAPRNLPRCSVPLLAWQTFKDFVHSKIYMAIPFVKLSDILGFGNDWPNAVNSHEHLTFGSFSGLRNTCHVNGNAAFDKRNPSCHPSFLCRTGPFCRGGPGPDFSARGSVPGLT